MGAWSADNFGNDAALDFVGEVTDFASVQSAIQTFSTTKGDFDANDASAILAACNLVAISLDRGPADIPDTPDLAHDGVSNNFLDQARTLVDRVRDSSELAALWAEEDDGEWQEVLDDLILRLTPSKRYKAPKRLKKTEYPDDFLGHCYVCYGMVTARDGLVFEHTDEFATASVHPHRKCIEDKMTEPGPYWNDDGSPTEVTRLQLMRDMGYEV